MAKWRTTVEFLVEEEEYRAIYDILPKRQRTHFCENVMWVQSQERPKPHIKARFHIHEQELDVWRSGCEYWVEWNGIDLSAEIPDDVFERIKHRAKEPEFELL